MSEEARKRRSGEQRALLVVTAVLLGVSSAALVVTSLWTETAELLPACAVLAVWSVLVAVAASVIGPRTPERTSAALSLAVAASPAVGVCAGVCAVVTLAIIPLAPQAPPPAGVAGAPAFALLVCWLLGQHFSRVSVEELPEAPALVKWSRLSAWFVIAGSLSVAGRFYDFTALWARPTQIVLSLLVLGIAAAVFMARGEAWIAARGTTALPGLDLVLLDVVARRNNPVSSVLDGLERFLGVDLRGSWAIRVVRRGVEPLAIGAVALAWLATSLSLVQVGDNAVVERLGRVSGEVLGPGLHAHLPWPFDRVVRFPVTRVQTSSLDTESNSYDEEGGRENVLWGREHDAIEYTLLLGNGRQVVAIDGKLTFHVRDLRAWLYGSADGPGVVRALLSAAVTRHTADRSLDDVLSDNLDQFTRDIRDEVQARADKLGLGVDVIALTVAGMHPPVAVAEQYESVVSAQVERDTRILMAKTDAATRIPAAEAVAFTSTSDAKAKAAQELATARGDAQTFRSIQTAFQTEKDLFEYRRRLEALEAGLEGHRMVIIDDRIERDGTGLWLRE